MESVESRRAALEQRYPRWPSWTLASALDAVAAAHPARPFVLAEDRTCTHAEPAGWSRRLARGLVAEGVGAGENSASRRAAAVLPARVGRREAQGLLRRAEPLDLPGARIH
jgi:hypothetical protein